MANLKLPRGLGRVALVGLVLIFILGIFLASVPFMECPHRDGRPEPDIPPALSCSLCGNNGRVTLLRKFRAPRDVNWFSEDALRAFRLRASEDELAEFDRLKGSTSQEEVHRATELVLFELSREELAELGVSESGSPTSPKWVVALAMNSPEVEKAIKRVLSQERIEGDAMPTHGFSFWSVPRGQYYRAHRSLLLDEEVRALEVRVLTPQLDLE